MKKKEAIRKAATAYFAQQGFDSTSLSELAAATGVAKGTILYHYGTKERLLLDIIDHTTSRITEEFERYFADRSFTDGKAMMQEVIYFYLYLAGLFADEFFLLQHHFPFKLAEVNEDCRASLEALYTNLVDIFERAVRLEAEHGDLGDASPRKVAMIIFAAVDGLVRFRNYNLYDAGSLTTELVELSIRMLTNPNPKDG